MFRVLSRYLLIVGVLGLLFSAFTPAISPQYASAQSGEASASGQDVETCNELPGVVSWIVCGIVDISLQFVDTMDSAINKWLTVDTEPIFDTSDPKSSGAAYKAAWSAFRTIALGIVVIAALVIIITTAFGYEILDAYTIRKTLPRFLIAIIFITLSWSVMGFLVTLTNDVGNGVRALIYAPFSEMGSLELGAGTGLLNLVPLLALPALGLMGLLSFAVTAGLAVLVAFLVLMVRELIIVFLVVIAPIGIACLILPNTRKGWQLWQNTFTAMLVVFPIISAMIATGRVFALTTSKSDGDVITQLAAFTAYILPYFLLPFAFRAAGGLMATLAGLANDRSRGVFDRLKGYRGKQFETNMAKMKAGNRYADHNPVARAFNRTTSGVGMGVQGRFGFGEQGRQARSQLEETAALEQVMKNPKWLGVHQNDDALRAMTYSNAREAKAALTKEWGDEERANRAVAAVQASVRFGRSQQIAGARQLVSTGTGYENIEDMTEVLARASNGNLATAAALSGFANSETKKAGRHDLAPGFVSLNEAVQQTAGIDSKTGAVGAASTPDFDTLKTKAWQSGSLYQHANDKPQNIKAAISHFENMLNSGDYQKQEDAAVFFNELKAMSPNATGVVKEEIEKTLDKHHQTLENFSNTLPPSSAGNNVRVVSERKPVMYKDPATGKLVPTGATHTVKRSETIRERIDRRSRTYERPDPNVL